MSLTPFQIEQLFLFTKKKMVHYYDLQVELVDHLANMIEDIMVKDPKVGFETALNQAYASFGLFGFSHIVQEKQNALQAKYKKMWWKELKDQFRWPEIVLSLLILISVWTIVNIVKGEFLWTALVIVWLLFWIINIRLMRQPRKSGKGLLMLQCNPVANSLFNFFLQFLGWKLITSGNIVIAVVVCVSAAIIQIATFRLLRKIRKEARQLFPEVFFKTA